MSKPWGNIGNWAAEAERAEAEEREAAAAAAANPQAFPSLKEAVNAKPKKKKMTLSEFAGYTSGGGGALESKRLTQDEMLSLPTGPKERSADEMQYNRLGGGFSSYGRSGGSSMGRSRDREGNGEGSWGGGRRSFGGLEDERRGPSPRVSDIDQPSRADEVDNWASGKKLPSSFDSGRQNRYSSLGSGGGGGGIGGGGGGSGFGGSSRADEGTTAGEQSDRWSRGPVREERPKLVLEPPRGDASANEVPVVKSNKPNPFGAARPREEVLAEKGVDWKKLETDLDAKKSTSRPSSAHSSRPSSAQSNRSESVGPAEAVAKPKPKVNPFGDAKPRELLLRERGIDWRKVDLDLEHRAVDRPETEEEKLLKEEIDCLRKEAEKESTMNSNKESSNETDAEQSSTQEILLQKERELEHLIRDLDDKVRFGQKAVERPGSSAGRSVVYSDRPHSRSSSISIEDSRGESADRPRSRGTSDTWAGPNDDQRSYRGSKDRRGFLSSRDMNRSRSRERW
ncbi:Eukaryotic translation initiation factor [Arachis hypogaea]|nr:Eukaryotic translation initiation factor [Arachis hypogaea]